MKVETINRIPFYSNELDPKVGREVQAIREEVSWALDSPERSEILDALPTPEEAWRGIIVVVPITNGPDQAFICLKNSDTTYGWQACATGF